MWSKRSPLRFSCAGLVFLGFLLLGLASCTSPHNPIGRVESDLDRGWPKKAAFWHEKPSQVVPAGWNNGNRFWQPASYEPLKAPLPEVPGAAPVETDEFCATCHKTYTQAFANTVHREIGCEKCHGAASIHLETRGTQGNTILSFATQEVGTKAGKLLSPAERAEVCLQCHEHGQEGRNVPCVQTWRTSGHANKGVTCTDCHRAHYNVPLGTPSVDETTRVDPHQDARPVSLVQASPPRRRGNAAPATEPLGSGFPGRLLSVSRRHAQIRGHSPSPSAWRAFRLQLHGLP